MRYVIVSLFITGWVSLLPALAEDDPSPSMEHLSETLAEAINSATDPLLNLHPFNAGPKQGWTTKQLYLSGTIGDSKGPIITSHAGVGYEFDQDVTINLEGVLGVAHNDNDSKTTAVFGFDLLLRRDFHTGDGWSAYVDGGAGFQLTTSDYPSDSFWNFRLMIGPGAKVQLSEQVTLIGGARYIHISNADTSHVNEGLDAVQLYLGAIIPF